MYAYIHFSSVSQERFYFGDGVLPLFESGIPMLLDRLKRLPDKDKVRMPVRPTPRTAHTLVLAS